MGEIENEHVRKLVQDVMKKQGVDDAIIRITPGSQAGENYNGELYAVQASDKTGKTEKQLNFMAKQAPKNAMLRAQMPVVLMYKQEMAVYNEIFPLFTQFLQEVKCPSSSSSSSFDGITECYTTSLEENNETLLLKHLSFSGYKMWDRKKEMDEEHLKMVLDKYAHLHALSYAMKARKPQMFEELKSKIVEIMSPEQMEMMLPMYYGTFAKLMEAFKNDEKAVEFLQNLTANILATFKEFLFLNEKFVFTHGDCWCNNFMFQYDEETGKPKHVMILDWQMSKMSPLLGDLFYFFYCSAFGVHLQNYAFYQQYYYERLQFYTEEMGVDITKIYSFNEFVDDWKKYRAIGFATASIMLKVLVTEKEEAENVGKTLEEAEKPIGEALSEIFNYQGVNETTYLKNVKNLIDHFINTQ